MKLYLEYLNGDNPISGKTKFFWRLAAQFKEEGHELFSDPKKRVDIAIHNVTVRPVNAAFNIVRLDGICFDTRLNYKQKNMKIRDNLKKADGVVYQSHWAKAMCDKYIGVFKGPTAVIFNGADPAFYDSVEPRQMSCLNLFFAASRWRIFKRLEDIIESFIFADVPDSVLCIAGDTRKSGMDIGKYRHHDNIVLCGVLDDYGLATYLRRSTAFLHLSRYDACPNSVVEAIAAKTHVICGNVAGTREIVELSGGSVCCLEDPYDMEPVDVYHDLPCISKTNVASAMWDAIEFPVEISNEHVDIANISRQYQNFFRQLRKPRWKRKSV